MRLSIPEQKERFLKFKFAIVAEWEMIISKLDIIYDRFMKIHVKNMWSMNNEIGYPITRNSKIDANDSNKPNNKNRAFKNQ